MRPPAPANLDGSALDRALLSPRVLNAIVRIWGPSATRRDLLAPDAYARLREEPGIGPRSLAEIDRALAAWGHAPLAREAELARVAPLRWKSCLRRALRALGAPGLLRTTADLCAERATAYGVKITASLSSRRRRKYLAAQSYYARCAEHFRRCADDAPSDVDGAPPTTA